MFDFLGDHTWAKLLFGIILTGIILVVLYVGTILAIFAYIDYKMGPRTIPLSDSFVIKL